MQKRPYLNESFRLFLKKGHAAVSLLCGVGRIDTYKRNKTRRKNTSSCAREWKVLVWNSIFIYMIIKHCTYKVPCKEFIKTKEIGIQILNL